jgi:hypothetical protein
MCRIVCSCIEGHLVDDKGELSKLWVMPMAYLLALESGGVGSGRSVSDPSLPPSGIGGPAGVA